MGLIFRAVSIEFRSKRESPKWRESWDILFAIGSLVISFGIGVVLGNLIEGLPLDADHYYTGTFSDFLTPFALLVGVTTVALFTMHGAIFLVMKTEGMLHDQIRRWIPRTIVFFIVMYLAVTIVTLVDKPYMIAPMQKYPVMYLIPLIALIAIISVPFLMKKKKDGWAFLSSCISIFFLLSLAAIGTFPYMVRSTTDTDTNSLTIFNSASSPLTLKVLVIIVAIGVPLVFAYGFYIYRIFRGKVEIDVSSY